jgi:cyclopropane-fatty-acyl-phospholipid synthase
MNHLLAAQENVRDRLGFIDRLARRLVVRKLAGMRRGQVTLVDSGGTFDYGQNDELHATIEVRHPRFYRDAVVGGSISVGESYLRGDWDCDDLTSLFRIFVRNRESSQRLEGGLARLAGWGQRMHHAWRANTRGGSRRNIAAHYDLGNDFFRLWLDETMAYSSGIFPTSDATLRTPRPRNSTASVENLIYNRATIVFEIGSGWGIRPARRRTLWQSSDHDHHLEGTI